MEENDNKNKFGLKLRFKDFQKDNWIIFVLEVLVGLTLIWFDIGFWRDMAQGITFLGENNKGYEIAVAIVVLLLALMMLFIIFYDMLMRDYVKERDSITTKEVKNGQVITINKTPAEDKKEEEKK